MQAASFRRLWYVLLAVGVLALMTTVYTTAWASPSSQTVPTPTPSEPDAPFSVTATGGQAQATVTWSRPDDNGQPITEYVIRAYLNSNVARTVTVASNNQSTQTATVTGLVGGNSYTFTVAAINAVGESLESAASNSAFVLSPPQPTATRAPTPTPSGPTPTPFTPDVMITPQPNQVLAIIDPNQGTTQTSPDGRTTVEVQPGSVQSERRVLQITQLSMQEALNQTGPLPSTVTGGSYFFSADLLMANGDAAPGERLLNPVTIRVQYTAADVAAAGGNPQRLRLLVYRQGEGWTDLNATVDVVNMTLVARVSRFSTFGIAPSTAPTPTSGTPPTTPGTPGASPTSTFIPPVVGDLSPSSGMLIGFLGLSVVFIGVGGYFLRPHRRDE